MYEKHLTLMLLSLALKILKRFFRIIKSQGERNLKVCHIVTAVLPLWLN